MKNQGSIFVKHKCKQLDCCSKEHPQSNYIWLLIISDKSVYKHSAKGKLSIFSLVLAAKILCLKNNFRKFLVTPSRCYHLAFCSSNNENHNITSWKRLASREFAMTINQKCAYTLHITDLYYWVHNVTRIRY